MIFAPIRDDDTKSHLFMFCYRLITRTTRQSFFLFCFLFLLFFSLLQCSSHQVAQEFQAHTHVPYRIQIKFKEKRERVERMKKRDGEKSGKNQQTSTSKIALESEPNRCTYTGTRPRKIQNAHIKSGQSANTYIYADTDTHTHMKNTQVAKWKKQWKYGYKINTLTIRWLIFSLCACACACVFFVELLI